MFIAIKEHVSDNTVLINNQFIVGFGFIDVDFWQFRQTYVEYYQIYPTTKGVLCF